MIALVLAFGKSLSPGLGVVALFGGALVLLAGRADLERIGNWMLVGGWFVFAFTSPSAEFPTSLRPLGLVLATTGAVLLRTRRRAVEPAGGRRVVPVSTRLVFLYLVLIMVGCLASPYGPKNLVRGVEGSLIVLAVFYAVDLGKGRRILAATFVAAVANVILTVLSGRTEVLWNGDHTNRLAGWMQPNHLAFTCALVVIGVVWLLPQWPRYRVPLVAVAVIALYALFASESRTALMALVIGLGAAVCATYYVEPWRGRILAGAVVAGLLLIPIALPASTAWFNRDQSSQSITSLTGRTDFWPYAIDLIRQRPVIGWGVDVISSPHGAKFQDVLPGVGQAHNAYLEAALMAGIPGAVVWGLALLIITVGSFLLPRELPERFLLIAAALLLELFAITESSPAWFGDMFLVFALAAAYYGQARAQTAEAAPTLELVA